MSLTISLVSCWASSRVRPARAQSKYQVRGAEMTPLVGFLVLPVGGVLVLLATDAPDFWGLLDSDIAHPGHPAASTDAEAAGVPDLHGIPAAVTDEGVGVAAGFARVLAEALGPEAGKERLVDIAVLLELLADELTVARVVPVERSVLVTAGADAEFLAVVVEPLDDSLSGRLPARFAGVPVGGAVPRHG